MENEKAVYACLNFGQAYCPDFPNQRAAEIAVQTVREYREESRSCISVIFNVWKDLDAEIYRQLLG